LELRHLRYFVAVAETEGLTPGAKAKLQNRKAFHVGELAREYRFVDIDGRRVLPFRVVESFVNMVKKFENRLGNTAQNRGADLARSTPAQGDAYEYVVHPRRRM
jgi:hypothetical protein